jgi:hypothetical protein
LSEGGAYKAPQSFCCLYEMNLCIFQKQERLRPPENYASWNINLKCTKVACNTRKIGHNNKVKLVSLKYILPVKYKNINYACMSRSS